MTPEQKLQVIENFVIISAARTAVAEAQGIDFGDEGRGFQMALAQILKILDPEAVEEAQRRVENGQYDKKESANEMAAFLNMYGLT